MTATVRVRLSQSDKEKWLLVKKYLDKYVVSKIESSPIFNPIEIKLDDDIIHELLIVSHKVRYPNNDFGGNYDQIIFYLDDSAIWRFDFGKPTAQRIPFLSTELDLQVLDKIIHILSIEELLLF